MEVRTFEPIQGVQSAQGLDVSNFQGQFNWAAAVRQVPRLAFGIHRLTQGLGGPGTNSPDPTARWNHAQIRDTGLRRGAYHFLDPFEPGAAQARYFVDVHDQLGFQAADMLFLDNETAGSSPAATAGCASAFMEELQALRPHSPQGVYSNLSFGWNGDDAGLGKWPAWLAWPSPTAPRAPSPWVNWAFWQWGLRNGVDADAFNGTIADLDRWLASYAVPPAPKPGPGGLYQHTTDGKTSLADLAASRHETVGGFLAQQGRLYAQLGAEAAPLLAAAGRAIPPAGLTYLTVNPS